jgi:hypothetical protein
MELGQAYAETLPASHRQALAQAAHVLIDTTLEALTGSDLGDWSGDTWLISTLLPPRYRLRYTARFARKFLACLMTVVWKLGQGEQMRLSCTAEELAAYALIQEAKATLDERGIGADFEGFEDSLFEDLDFEFLFDDAYDGIESAEIAEEAGITNLAFRDWFCAVRTSRQLQLQ